MVDAQVACVIIAHERRWVMADALEQRLKLGDLLVKTFYDNGFLGEWKNTRRALEWARSRDVSHVVVLQDDAVPIDDFATSVREAVLCHPDDVIGLYVGSGRPRATEVLEAVHEARRRQASWLVTDGLIWGVGAVWPVPLINEFLSWTDLWRHRLPYDQRALAWSQATGRRCYHTWPSLVDHADTPSVIKGRDPKLELVRVAHEVGVPTWNNVEVNMELRGTLRP